MKHSAMRATGIKMLITAGALAASLSGWIAASYKQMDKSLARNDSSQQPSKAAWSESLAPLPTLIAPPSDANQISILQAKPQAAQPSLRVVNAPRSSPAPVTRTRTSR